METYKTPRTVRAGGGRNGTRVALSTLRTGAVVGAQLALGVLALAGVAASVMTGSPAGLELALWAPFVAAYGAVVGLAIGIAVAFATVPYAVIARRHEDVETVSRGIVTVAGSMVGSLCALVILGSAIASHDAIPRSHLTNVVVAIPFMAVMVFLARWSARAVANAYRKAERVVTPRPHTQCDLLSRDADPYVWRER